jgi:4-diphosphocytidyl-2-C-methyl-D-erythritol kinase
MAGAMIDETAFAKVNLALHVRARRADGYHALESLFAFCIDGDRLTGRVRDDGAIRLAIAGRFAAMLSPGDDNLVVRAARALQAASGTGLGADLHLDKALPIAAGIGGGSADAAAALRLLVRLWGVNPARLDFPGLALSLGADVPACLASATLFARGVGEVLESVDLDLAGMPILLVNPLVPCPTGPVFRGWDGIDRGPLDPGAWRLGRNDLQAPALALVPAIGDVVAALAALPGVTLARMSGSGATCFALFADEAARDAAAVSIRAANGDWWTLATNLR